MGSFGEDLSGNFQGKASGVPPGTAVGGFERKRAERTLSRSFWPRSSGSAASVLLRRKARSEDGKKGHYDRRYLSCLFGLSGLFAAKSTGNRGFRPFLTKTGRNSVSSTPRGIGARGTTGGGRACGVSDPSGQKALKIRVSVISDPLYGKGRNS